MSCDTLRSCVQNGLWMASPFHLELDLNRHMTLDMCLWTSIMLMLKILGFTCARRPTLRVRLRRQGHWGVPVSMWDFRFTQQCYIRLKPSGMGWVWCFEGLIVVPSECQELLDHCHNITSQKTWVKAPVSFLVEYCTMQNINTLCSDG
jgi:hypothetical protein